MHMLGDDDDVGFDGGMTIRQRSERVQGRLGSTITAGEGGGGLRHVSFENQMQGSELMEQTRTLANRNCPVVIGVEQHGRIATHVGYLEDRANTKRYIFRYSQSNQFFGNHGVMFMPNGGDPAQFEISDEIGSAIKWIVAATVWLDEHHTARHKLQATKIVALQTTLESMKRASHGAQQQPPAPSNRDLLSANAQIKQLQLQLESATEDISRMQYDLDQANTELHARRSIVNSGNGNGNGNGRGDFTRGIMQNARSAMDEVFVIEDIMSFDKQQHIFVDQLAFEARMSAIVQAYSPSILKQDPASAHQRNTISAMKNTFRAWGGSVTNEPNFYIYDGTDVDHRPDLTFYTLGTPIVTDVTIVAPVGRRGEAAHLAAAAKTRHHSAACANADHHFIPFAMETNGHFDIKCFDLFKRLAMLVPHRDRFALKRDLMGAASTALARFRALAIRNACFGHN